MVSAQGIALKRFPLIHVEKSAEKWISKAWICTKAFKLIALVIYTIRTVYVMRSPAKRTTKLSLNTADR